jgi:hypothetical protein
MRLLLKDQSGIALVTSLMMTLISLAMIMVLMSYVMQSIKSTAATKQYKNTLEASYGGAELLVKDIVPMFFNFSGSSSSGSITALKTKYASINLDFATGNQCLAQKLNNQTSFWTDAVCGANRNISNAKVLPDITFVLKSTITGYKTPPGYKIYAKIVDTAVVGNTDKSSVDYSSRNPGGDRGDGSPNPIPSLYTIDITGERETNPLEKTMLEVLYSY